MTPESIYFIEVLSNHLAGNKSKAISGLSWEVIRRLSRIHHVEGIIYLQCRDYMPDSILKLFEQDFNITLFYYKNRERSLKEIRNAFNKANISFFTVKGIDIAQYYPFPALRTMGDSDIIVHEKDKDNAGSTLESIGFKYQSEFIGKEKVYSYHGMCYDLHYQLVYDETVTVPEHKQFFNNCWTYVNGTTLDASFHFLFLLVHLRKHFMNEGVGIRQFMDIAVMIKNERSLNWQWIYEKLRELNLLRFAKTCFALIDRWFLIKAPMQLPSLQESFVGKSTERILANGVFGFENKNNYSNGFINTVRKYRRPYWLIRTSAIIEHVFPGYEYLRVGEQYSFLNGHPWRLPIAWCYRFFLMLRGRTTNGWDAIDRIMTPNETISNRIEELEEWGL